MTACNCPWNVRQAKHSQATVHAPCVCRPAQGVCASVCVRVRKSCVGAPRVHNLCFCCSHPCVTLHNEHSAMVEHVTFDLRFTTIIIIISHHTLPQQRSSSTPATPFLLWSITLARHCASLMSPSSQHHHRHHQLGLAPPGYQQVSPWHQVQRAAAGGPPCAMP